MYVGGTSLNACLHDATAPDEQKVDYRTMDDRQRKATGSRGIRQVELITDVWGARAAATAGDRTRP